MELSSARHDDPMAPPFTLALDRAKKFINSDNSENTAMKNIHLHFADFLFMIKIEKRLWTYPSY